MRDLIFYFTLYLTIPGALILLITCIFNYRKTGRVFNSVLILILTTVFIAYWISVSSAVETKSISLKMTNIEIQNHQESINNDNILLELKKQERYKQMTTLISSSYCLLAMLVTFILLIKNRPVANTSLWHYGFKHD